MSKAEDKRMRKMQKWAGIKNNQGETVNPLTAPWYFENIVDKTFLLLILILAVWKILGWIF